MEIFTPGREKILGRSGRNGKGGTSSVSPFFICKYVWVLTLAYAHHRQNPDYKYRPVYRREGVVRRRRRKLEENDIEEEERKCEVVARVLLEGEKSMRIG